MSGLGQTLAPVRSALQVSAGDIYLLYAYAYSHHVNSRMATVVSQCEQADVVEDIRLPVEDLALFSGMQPMQIRDTALARVAEYEAEIATIQRYMRDLYFFKNAALPIHAKLSDDLLTEVFRRIRPTVRYDIRVTHVCRAWRYASIPAAEFWAALSGLSSRFRYSTSGGTSHRSFLPALIERSIPLKFHLFCKGDDPIAIHPTLSIHSPRLVSLSFIPNVRHMDALCTLLLLDMSDLKFMTIGFSCSDDISGYSAEQLRADLMLLPQTSDRRPQLHTFHINGALVCPALLAGRTISTVHVKAYHRYYHSSTNTTPCIAGRLLSFDILLESLQRCPLLEELVIPKDTSPTLDEVASSSRPRVQLTNLRRCSVEDDNTQFIQTFLTYVHMPSTVSLSIAHSADPFSHLLPDIPITVISAATSLEVVVQRPKQTSFVQHRTPCSVALNASVSGSRGRLSMNASYRHWSDDPLAQPPRSRVLGEIIQIFSGSHTLRELTLQLHPGIVVVQADWDFVLDAFKSLSKLTVHVNACRRLVRTLRLARICPLLETIAIHCSDGIGVHESVVTMAEGRVARGTPLRRFEFHQRPREDVRNAPQAETKAPLSAKRLARLRAFIPEVVVTPRRDGCA